MTDQETTNNFAHGSYCVLTKLSDTEVQRDYKDDLTINSFIEHFILCRIPRYKYILHSLEDTDFGFKLPYFNSTFQNLIDDERCFNYTQETRLRLITQVVKSVQYLHNLGFIHGDISPSNILLQQHANQDDDYICLSDFNLSVKVKNPYQETKSSLCYCYTYRHPKMAFDFKLDAQTDWFATGLVLLEFLSGVCTYLHSFIKETRYQLLLSLEKSSGNRDILEGRVFGSIFSNAGIRQRYYKQVFKPEELDLYSELLEIFFTHNAENIYYHFINHPLIQKIEVEPFPDYTDFIHKNLYQYPNSLSADELLTLVKKDSYLSSFNIVDNLNKINLVSYLKYSKSTGIMIAKYSNLILELLTKTDGQIKRKVMYALCSVIDFWYSNDKTYFFGSEYFNGKRDKYYKYLYILFKGNVYDFVN